MMEELRQSTAATLKIGQFVDDADCKTPVTDLTIAQADVRLSKNGGNMAAKNEATSCTHDEIGWYGCPVDITDTGTLGRLKLMVLEAGALPVWHDYAVITQNEWDSKYGTDKHEVDLVQLGGNTQSGTDLKDFADTGYEPGTHKVQGVVLVDTTTTNTDMRGTNSAATAGGLMNHDQKLDGLQSLAEALWVHTNDLYTNQDNWLTAVGFALPGDKMDIVDAPNATGVGVFQDGLAVPGDKMDLVDAPNETAVTVLQADLATLVNQSTINDNVSAVGVLTLAVKAKTDNLPGSPAATGAKMDLVDVPNATAVTAIQAGLAKASDLATVDSKIVTMYGVVLVIQARTNMIGAVSVEYTSPADSTGAFTIFCGDDYLAADGRALTAAVTGYAGPDLTNATAKFRLLAADTYQTDTAAVKEADYEIAASIAVSGTTVTFSVDLPRATTLLLSPAPPDLASNYRWQIVVTTQGGEVLRPVTGTLTARKGIGGAA